MITSKKIFYFFKYVAFRPRKLINVFLIELSMKMKLAKTIGYPHTLLIEPTNYCNLKCPLCPTGKGELGRPVHELSFDDYKKVIDDVGKYIVHLRLFGWGEPLLHKDLFKLVKYAKQKNMFINIHTNAHFLNEKNVREMVESGMDEINVSLDGASQETYSKYRKSGDFKKAKECIHALVQEKDRRGTRYPIINLQFIVMKHNEHEMEKIKQIAREIGVDRLVLKMVKVDTVEEAKEYLPISPELRRFDVAEEGLLKKGTENKICNALWTESTIWSNGDIVPCCYDYKAEYVFGNAFKESFRKIWNGPRFVNFRKQFLIDRSRISVCKTCPRTGNITEITIADIKVR